MEGNLIIARLAWDKYTAIAAPVLYEYRKPRNLHTDVALNPDLAV